jgi:RNA-splicing ligase RtcB
MNTIQLYQSFPLKMKINYDHKAVGLRLKEFRELVENKSKTDFGEKCDEAPECYKSLEEVLGYMGNTVEVLYNLRPIGVAMAGSETFDPYKD